MREGKRGAALKLAAAVAAVSGPVVTTQALLLLLLGGRKEKASIQPTTRSNRVAKMQR